MRDFIFSVFALAAAVAAAEPVLHGDGVNDDTDAIQAMIDAGKGIVKLPKPARHYLISRTLQFGDGTGLELDRDTRILLAPGSSCPLARNRKADAEGDRDLNLSISIVGGIWDMDNVHQAPNPAWRHKAEPPLPPIEIPDRYESGFYRGNAFYFENVSNLVVRGVTIRNPVTYGFQMCRVRFFEIEDVTLDYTTCNPIFGNMDGIHLDGGCFRGRISGVRGSAGDDLVALNANDGICAAHEEPITDIEIENLHSDYAHSAVRILSAPAPVERIRISNVTGSYYVYAVGFTHYFPTRHENGFIKDVVLRNIDVAMTAVRPDKWTARPRGPIFFDTDLRIENVLFDGVRLSPGVRVSERFGYDPKDSWKSLQAALDSGLPRIIVDKQDGPWLVSKPLFGRSNQEVLIEHGVEIRPVRGTFKGKWDALLTFANCTNVSLLGDATLRMWKEDYQKPPYARSEYRHALSLRSCRNVLVAGLTFADSGGDGIYLATTGRLDGEPCRDVTLRGVTCDGNLRQGVSVISAENLLLEECELLNTKGLAPEAGIDFEPNSPAGHLRNCVLRRCTIRGNAGYGVDMMFILMGRRSGDLSILVEDCDLEDNALGAYRLQPTRGGILRSPHGPVTFHNVRTCEKGGTVRPVSFTTVLGVEADGPKAEAAFDPSSAKVVDTKPGEVVALPPMTIRGTSARAMFFADKPGSVELYFRQVKLGNRPLQTGEWKLLDARGRKIASFPYPDARETRMPVEVPSAGFYTLLGDTGRSKFVFTRTGVPLALDFRPVSGEVPWRFNAARGDLYLFVPEKAKAFRFAVSGGETGENAGVTLRNPSGAVAFARANAWDQELWQGDGVPPSGLWQVTFTKPTKGAFDDFSIDVAGIPALYFLSNQKYWKNN